jgi:hypothetical protein
MVASVIMSKDKEIAEVRESLKLASEQIEKLTSFVEASKKTIKVDEKKHIEKLKEVQRLKEAISSDEDS